MVKKDNFFMELYRDYSLAFKKLSKLQVANIEGRLAIDKTGKRPEYYQVTTNPMTKKINKRYINSSEYSLAKALAQKSYNSKVYKLLKKRIRQLKSLLIDYKEDELQALYESLPEERRKLIRPVTSSWQQVLSDWLSKPYTPNPYKTEFLRFTTKRGEKVRSKIEKILADKFFDLDIEYKYECPIYLRDNITYYPDFTFLHPKTHREIYWEHMGIMDNPNYVLDAFKKIENYAKNNITPSNNLILTFETSTYTPDDSYLNTLIQEYLL